MAPERHADARGQVTRVTGAPWEGSLARRHASHNRARWATRCFLNMEVSGKLPRSLFLGVRGGGSEIVLFFDFFFLIWRTIEQHDQLASVSEGAYINRDAALGTPDAHTRYTCLSPHMSL